VALGSSSERVQPPLQNSHGASTIKPQGLANTDVLQSNHLVYHSNRPEASPIKVQPKSNHPVDSSATVK